MGKVVYSGKVGEGKLYDLGVRAGALGLMLNYVVLGFTSLGVQFLVHYFRGVKNLWGCINFFLAFCLGMTLWITKLSESSRHGVATNGSVGAKWQPPLVGVKVGALALFAVLGIPQARMEKSKVALPEIQLLPLPAKASDEDGDLVALVDDDLCDVVKQSSNPPRISVKLNAEKSGTLFSL